MLWIFIATLFLTIVYHKVYLPAIYWKRLNVKHVHLFSCFVDTIRIFCKTLIFPMYLQQIYKQYRNERYVGFYLMNEPMLLINDLELVRQITINDFHHFTDRKQLMPVKNEPVLSKTLFFLNGERWRNMRSTVSPLFTSSKIKAMHVLMVETAHQFTDYFLENDTRNCEVTNLFNRYGNDVIANCAFGVKCDSLKDRNNVFYRMGGLLSLSNATIRFFIMIMFTKFSEMFGITLYPSRVMNFFKKLIDDNIKAREAHNIVRPDLIHLLMQARDGKLKYEETKVASKESGFATVEESEYGKTGKSEPLTIDMMTAQAILFFMAGFDAISVLLTFLCYELILDPDVQERLIEEIDEAFDAGNGKVGYEALNKMKYLDMTVTETMRKWFGSGLNRECVKPYTIQPKRPGEMAVHIKPGFQIWIPNNAIQMDPEYFPNPERFDPERFNDENKDKIKPFTLLSFGIGPRNCIGSRFALLQAKTLIVHLLSKFRMVVNENTEIPIKLKAAGLNTIPANGLYLDLEKRNG